MSQSSQLKCVGRYTAGLLQRTPDYTHPKRVNEQKVNGGEYAELEIVF